MRDDTATTDSEKRLAGRGQQLRLVVIGDDGVATHSLPIAGRVAIGRSETSDVRIDHADISRDHAILHVGDRTDLEDLGSRNGTRIGGASLEAHERTPVEPGQVIEFGSTMAIIQQSALLPPSRKLSTHSQFEAHLEARCARAPAGGPFAVLRLHVGPGVSTDRVRAALDGALGPSDLAAAYAPGEYEALIHDATPGRIEDVKERISSAIDDAGTLIGIAVFPGDGRNAEALLEKACSGTRRSEAPATPGDEVVVQDPAMQDLYRIGERIAQGAISVLILGETGVGKEIFAEALHRMSPRRDQPFVRINCAALTESLLESELFGHEKGAFTGAVKAKPGLLETAHGGTVMLDELGEMPPPTQAKLLRTLELKQVLRVGGLEPRAIDVRFISATNRDLEADVVAGTFRRDLFFRLNGVTLLIPPLRDRASEIDSLARQFIQGACRQMGRSEEIRISERARDLLLGYAWPGNIRELRNVMERAVLLCPGDVIEPEHLPFEKLTLPWTQHPPTAPNPSEPMNEEHRRIVEALEACGGNQTRAAKLLGIGRRTLTSKLDKYNIPRPRKNAKD